MTKKIGLALGGGAVLGAAHIGVLRALKETGIKIDMVAGTSIGALVGALFAFGVPWHEIQDITIKMKWLDISKISLSKFGILSNTKIESLMHGHLGDVDFIQANMPLSIIASDIQNGKKAVIKTGRVADAVMASTCIPGVFSPIIKKDQVLVDGGILENGPINTIKDMGADVIIGVDLNANKSFSKPKNMIDVLVNTISLSMAHSVQLQSQKADLLLQPDLSAYNLHNTKQVPDLIAKGYQDSIKQIQTFAQQLKS